MSKHIIFRRAAIDEFDAATIWYEERQAGLGSRFVAEVDKAVELAANDPTRFPIKHDVIRCVQVRRFPYSIYYLDEPNRIVVLAVFHARRNPVIWQSRT